MWNDTLILAKNYHKEYGEWISKKTAAAVSENNQGIITKRKDVPHFYKWRVSFRCPTGGEHISCLVETRRGKKIILQSKNFLLMRYNI
jgi:hypothetical protein